MWHLFLVTTLLASPTNRHNTQTCTPTRWEELKLEEQNGELEEKMPAPDVIMMDAQQAFAIFIGTQLNAAPSRKPGLTSHTDFLFLFPFLSF